MMSPTSPPLHCHIMGLALPKKEAHINHIRKLQNLLKSTLTLLTTLIAQ